MKLILKLTTIVTSVAIISSCSHLNQVVGEKPARIWPTNYWKSKAKQNSVYSCHTFVATGLLEAKYYQVHGKKIDLSEADLFLKHLKQKAPNWDKAISQALDRGVKSGDLRTLETGYVTQSFDLIQRHGVALESEFPYRSRTGIGVPLSMRILRTSVESIIKGLKQGKPHKKLIAKEIKNIKRDGAYGIYKKEGRFYSSRAKIRKFAQQYDLKKKKIYRRVNAQAIREQLKHGPVGISYRVPHKKNKMIPTDNTHVVILVGYDETLQRFIARDSDTMHIFGVQKLSDVFLRRFATNLYYLKKR